MLQRPTSLPANAATARRRRPSGHWITNVSTLDFRLGVRTASNNSLGTNNPEVTETTAIEQQLPADGDKPERYHGRHSYSEGPLLPGYYNLQDSSIFDANAGKSSKESSSNQFHYRFSIRFNRAWAILHLHTRNTVPGNATPLSIQPKTPRLWGCDPIAGMVELDLETPQSIEQIKVILKGTLLTSSLKAGSFQFMTHQCTLWQQSNGDPRQFLSGEDARNKIFDGKFVGKYTFPFSFPFPTQPGVSEESIGGLYDGVTPSPSESEVMSIASSSISADGTSTLGKSSLYPSRRTSAISSMSGFTSKSPVEKRMSSSFQRRSGIAESGTSGSSLPPGFAENRLNVSVAYELCVILVHGRFKLDNIIRTKISYLPASYPSPSSRMRQQADEKHAPIPGPMSDPTGWFALPQVTSSGKFRDSIGQRQIKIHSTLYLGLPLSYARGGVIPCYLKFLSDNDEVLDHFANPRVPAVRLLRRLRYFDPDTCYSPKKWQGTTPLIEDVITSPEAVRMSKASDFRVIGHEVAKARWRVPPAHEAPTQNGIRHLEGEIHLGEDLSPSCACSIFNVQYVVEMLPIQFNGFELSYPDPSKSPIIASVSVEITTLHRTDEPIPIPFSSPSRHYVKAISLGDSNGRDREFKDPAVI